MFENCEHNIHRSSNLISYEKATQKMKQNPLEFKSQSSLYLASFIQIFLEFSDIEFNQPSRAKIGNLIEREQWNRLASFNMNRTFRLRKTICSLFVPCHKSIELNNLVLKIFSRH